jgi:hypothetical protein
MNFNDRRKAKKAASETTKAQIGAMAKAGTLRSTSTSPGARNFGRAERLETQSKAASIAERYGKGKPTKGDYAKAAASVSQQDDVRGFEGRPGRRLSSKPGPQKRSLLPQKKTGMR